LIDHLEEFQGFMYHKKTWYFPLQKMLAQKLLGYKDCQSWRENTHHRFSKGIVPEPEIPHPQYPMACLDHLE
jgi:hypothetical protein